MSGEILPDIRPSHHQKFFLGLPNNDRYWIVDNPGDFKIIFGNKSVIRMHVQDFQPLAIGTNYSDEFTHFNLQNSGHMAGVTYRVAQILGWTEENEPVIDIYPGASDKIPGGFDAQCLWVKNNVPYNQITDDDFKNALPGTKTVEELQKTILQRYMSVYPDKTSKEILELGVGITHLKRTSKGLRDDILDMIMVEGNKLKTTNKHLQVHQTLDVVSLDEI